MSQPATTVPATSVPGSPSSVPPPSPSSSASPFLGQAVIPLVNKLQDIFSQLGSASTIDLPQVAVVGSQSSGKSSVLEALVGRDFLPRGSDICTRRPLVLQLVQTSRRPEDRTELVEWGEFLHIPGRRFTDFGAIRKEIQAETDRELGTNKGISEKQIRLKIFSPNVLNITLVDLPGITKVPVGDQPNDIEARVRTMILSYIKHETCIILAVSPANADLANSDALQMARIADPDGSRTIGVITKLDIMDRGTDARNFLLGNVIPLRLGYIGVVNRSQEDIIANKSIRDALVYEEGFFRSKPVYHNLADRCGVPQLAIRLNTILVQHIKAILPDLKARISTQMITLQKELASYGELTESKSMASETDSEDLVLLWSTVRARGIAAEHSHKAFNLLWMERMKRCLRQSFLEEPAYIIFFKLFFVRSLEMTKFPGFYVNWDSKDPKIRLQACMEVDPCDDLNDDDIRTAIQNATGPKNVLFVPEVPFELLVRRQIARLLEPSLQCARFIYDELVKISHRCETHELQRFPQLRRRIEEVVASFLREGLSPAETMIGHLIELEMDYINTSHPGFIGGSKAVEMALNQQRGAKALASKDLHDSERPPSLPEKQAKARAILARTNAASLVSHEQVAPKPSSMPQEKAGTPSSSGSGSTWGISSIFSSSETRQPVNGGSKEQVPIRSYAEPAQGPLESSFSSIQLREPPATLRANDAQGEQEIVEIAVTRLLLKSYYDIVRKNVQDLVPKAIMHFLVNHVKRELHSVFIRKLYRESLFEEMLQEKEEIAVKRKRCKEILRVLQQAAWTLEELPLEFESAARPSSNYDSTGLPPPATRGSAMTPALNALINGDYAGAQSASSYMGSPRNSKSRRSFHVEHSAAVNGGTS